MLTRCLLLSIALVISNSAQAALQAPADAVRVLYSYYGLGHNGNAAGLTEKGAEAAFDQSLYKLYIRALKGGGMDFDFLVQGQDFQLN
jgi:hypothetical protein